ncbi:MAG TPA: DUF4410 domain-containing protein [Holophagaceae bacterium]|nr:DUF4410 domain-containing protein [Holophagaceae bacterium]
MRPWLLVALASTLPIGAQEVQPAAAPAPASSVAPTPAPAAAPAPAPAPAPVAAPTPKPAAAPLPKLDKGLLDPAWFGEVPLAKTGLDAVDFVWVKPGLKLAGHTIWMKPWEDPAMLNKDRDGKDNAKATVLTDTIPSTLRGALTGAFGAKAKFSRSEGDLELIGRIADCNAGSAAAKWFVGFGAGSETVTFDFKIVDPKSGEVLFAAHHRTISGTNMSTIDGKLVKWADQFGTYLVNLAGN